MLLQAFQQETPARQQILYAIIGDGRLMIDNGEVGNQSDFERRLKLLVEKWQDVVRRTNQRKSLIDNGLGLWQSYKDHYDRLQGMMDSFKETTAGCIIGAAGMDAIKQSLDKLKVSLKFKKINFFCFDLEHYFTKSNRKLLHQFF